MGKYYSHLRPCAGSAHSTLIVRMSTSLDAVAVTLGDNAAENNNCQR